MGKSNGWSRASGAGRLGSNGNGGLGRLQVHGRRGARYHDDNAIAPRIHLVQETRRRGGAQMSAGSGNFIVEGLFLLTFIVALVWPARRRYHQ